MNDIQSAIVDALSESAWSTLTQISERTKLFRRRVESEIKSLVASGAVAMEMKNKGGCYYLGVYRLASKAEAA